MIEIKRLGAQGDCMFRRVASLPKTAKEVKVNGRIVVAHSETGHHHSIDVALGVRHFEEPGDPLICYLMLDEGVSPDVVHHRSFDTHETLRLLGSPAGATVFEVRRAREYTPEGWRRVED